MKVEFAQLAGRDNGTAYNLERALAAIAAGAGDTQLIVFPETHLMGFPSAETVADIAEPLDGPTVQAVEVVLEQMVRRAICARAFGEHQRPVLAAEQQRHPTVGRHVLVQQPHQLGPEVGLVQGVYHLPHRTVPGDVLQRHGHYLPLSGYPRRVIPWPGVAAHTAAQIENKEYP